MGVLLHQVGKLVQDGATLTPGHTGPGPVVKGLSTTLKMSQHRREQATSVHKDFAACAPVQKNAAIRTRTPG